MISNSSDLELVLSNALETVFPNKRNLGCYFHYLYNIRKNFKSCISTKINKENINNDINSTNSENIQKLKEESENFHKEILMLPFKIQNNINLIDTIYENIKIIYITISNHILKRNGNFKLCICFKRATR